MITGAAGHRLHEELIAAGLRLGEERPQRLGVEETRAALAAARDSAVPQTLRERLVPRLRHDYDALRAALQSRAGDRTRQLATTLENRAGEEQRHIAATLTELEATIRREAFGEDGAQLQLVTGLELDAADRRQVELDLQALRARLEAIPAEIATEQQAIARRYENPTQRLFPAAVTLLVPEGQRL